MLTAKIRSISWQETKLRRKINKNYNSLTMDAMIAFLGTERSLSHKVDSLSIITERLGEGIDER